MSPTDDAGRVQTYRDSGIANDRCSACGWGLYAHECPAPDDAAHLAWLRWLRQDDRLARALAGEPLWSEMPENGRAHYRNRAAATLAALAPATPEATPTTQEDPSHG